MALQLEVTPGRRPAGRVGRRRGEQPCAPSVWEPAHLQVPSSRPSLALNHRRGFDPTVRLAIRGGLETDLAERRAGGGEFHGPGGGRRPMSGREHVVTEAH